MRDYDEIVEPISIRAGRWLRDKGYVLASCSGLAKDVLFESDSIGIIFPGPKTKRKIFLGTIWFKNHHRDANRDNWIFEVSEKHFEKYFDLLKNLVKELQETFKIFIELRPVKDAQEMEVFLSDIDFVFQEKQETGPS